MAAQFACGGVAGSGRGRSAAARPRAGPAPRCRPAIRPTAGPSRSRRRRAGRPPAPRRRRGRAPARPARGPGSASRSCRCTGRRPAARRGSAAPRECREEGRPAPPGIAPELGQAVLGRHRGVEDEAAVGREGRGPVRIQHPDRAVGRRLGAGPFEVGAVGEAAVGEDLFADPGQLGDARVAPVSADDELARSSVSSPSRSRTTSPRTTSPVVEQPVRSPDPASAQRPASRPRSRGASGRAARAAG